MKSFKSMHNRCIAKIKRYETHYQLLKIIKFMDTSNFNEQISLQEEELPIIKFELYNGNYLIVTTHYLHSKVRDEYFSIDREAYLRLCEINKEKRLKEHESQITTFQLMKSNSQDYLTALQKMGIIEEIKDEESNSKILNLNIGNGINFKFEMEKGEPYVIYKTCFSVWIQGIEGE
jgi:hypothetical protein